MRCVPAEVPFRQRSAQRGPLAMVGFWSEEVCRSASGGSNRWRASRRRGKLLHEFVDWIWQHGRPALLLHAGRREIRRTSNWKSEAESLKERLSIKKGDLAL